MVKVSNAQLILRTILIGLLHQYWGFSDKIGRVYYGDRDNISPQRRIEIEDEIRKYVCLALLTVNALTLFRLIQNSEERVTTLLKEKQEELHRVSSLRSAKAPSLNAVLRSLLMLSSSTRHWMLMKSGR